MSEEELAPLARKALEYVLNTNGNASLAHFLDDHVPIGLTLWNALVGRKLVQLDNGARILVTEAGRAALASTNPAPEPIALGTGAPPAPIAPRTSYTPRTKQGARIWIRRHWAALIESADMGAVGDLGNDLIKAEWSAECAQIAQILLRPRH